MTNKMAELRKKRTAPKYVCPSCGAEIYTGFGKPRICPRCKKPWKNPIKYKSLSEKMAAHKEARYNRMVHRLAWRIWQYDINIFHYRIPIEPYFKVADECLRYTFKGQPNIQWANDAFNFYKKKYAEIETEAPAIDIQEEIMNPIRHTKEGWFWGSRGPFKTRDKAAEVARAAYAGGYKGKNPVIKYRAYHYYPDEPFKKHDHLDFTNKTKAIEHCRKSRTCEQVRVIIGNKINGWVNLRTGMIENPMPIKSRRRSPKMRHRGRNPDPKWFKQLDPGWLTEAEWIESRTGRPPLSDKETMKRTILVDEAFSRHKFRTSEYYDRYLTRLLRKYDLDLSEYYWGNKLLKRNPTLVMPIKSDKQLGHLFKAQSQLSKAGVTFDAGTQLKPMQRHWELDWSLKGGYMKNPKRKLSIPEQHQLRIARDTLRMPSVMARVMGGPTKVEARQIIKELTSKTPKGKAKRNPKTTQAIGNMFGGLGILSVPLFIGAIVWLNKRFSK